ncbi:unnamed protein product, partial [Brassica oleracea var. botrytis]
VLYSPPDHIHEVQGTLSYHLTPHLIRTSSSKWLMIKIFAVIIHQFLIGFLFFVA